MRILALKHVEDCFNDSAVFRLEFDTPWTEAGIQRLTALGRLEYFSQFPRPFFRLRGADGLVIKGVLGETTCRMTLLKEQQEAVEARLFEHFSSNGLSPQDQ
jgi:hypothetical protein